MVKVSLKDSRYNSLSFYFDTVYEADELVNMALKEGYTIVIENPTEEKENEVEI